MKDERKEIVRGLIEMRSIQEIAGYLGCDIRRVRECMGEEVVQKEVRRGRKEWIKGVKEEAIANARVRVRRLEWIWGELVKRVGEGEIELGVARRMIEVLRAAKEEDQAESGIERVYEVGRWSSVGDSELSEEKRRVLERIDKIACRMVERKGVGDEGRREVCGEIQGKGDGGGEVGGIREWSEGGGEGAEGSGDGVEG